MAAYRELLARVHDDAFLMVAENAASELLAQLEKRGVDAGTILDLGCGSGRLLEQVTARGFAGIGIEPSFAFLGIARRRAPRARLLHASLYDIALPGADVVTAIGEVFNYLPDADSQLPGLQETFRRIRQTLPNGGLFLFDLALPGRIRGGRTESVRRHVDWQLDFRAIEDSQHKTLTREILTTSHGGIVDREVHRLRLFTLPEVETALREAGFRFEVLSGYAELHFGDGWKGFLAEAI